MSEIKIKYRYKIKTSCTFCDKEKMSEINDSGRYFCNSACMANETRRLKVASWLSTGCGYVGTSEKNAIRRYLYEEQNDLCSICLCCRNHNNKELVFILDHIDGNSDNNCRDNLRLICPNCDSQLDTYKSKNTGRGKRSRKRVEKLETERKEMERIRLVEEIASKATGCNGS